jgi:pyruvate/2-oxoacid:ferredoxin oxidoreductase alpha subunit
MRDKRVILVPEVNFTGQLADLLQTRYQREFRRINVYGGQPFQVSEISGAIQGVYQRV